MHSREGSEYLISAPWRSSGKTLVTIGLAHEAYRRQLAVQAFKKGPDFIDSLWLASASGRPCFNLDPWFQQSDELIDCYRRRMVPGMLGLTEGTMGLHDGLYSDGSDSNAAIAKLLGLKVILVVDCRGMHRTIAALLRGLQQFDPDVQFAGVILNRIRSARHGRKVRAAIADHTDLPVLGEIPDSGTLHIAEKQLGLVPAPEYTESEGCIGAIADLVCEHVDIGAIFSGVERTAIAAEESSMQTSNLTIAIAKDEAFHFYYQDDLEVFRDRGVELIEVSPLRDEFPNDIDGFLLGGGFPERHVEALAKNADFRQALKNAIESNLPVHAECGGLMYLCRALLVDGQRFDMVGALDADVLLQNKPVGRGYVKLRRLADDNLVAAHEFHHSKAQFTSPQKFAYAVERGYGIDGVHDGVCLNNVQASYAHFRHTRRSPWIDEFLIRVRQNEQRPPNVAGAGSQLFQ